MIGIDLYSLEFRLLIDNKCISHDPKLGTFTVIGTGGKPHAVKLFPVETCSCPSTSTCYHIIGVKMSLGIPFEQQTKVNLTQLRKNTRCKSRKKSGRKRPRPGMGQKFSAFLLWLYFTH